MRQRRNVKIRPTYRLTNSLKDKARGGEWKDQERNEFVPLRIIVCISEPDIPPFSRTKAATNEASMSRIAGLADTSLH